MNRLKQLGFSYLFLILGFSIYDFVSSITEWHQKHYIIAYILVCIGIISIGIGIYRIIKSEP